MSAPPPVAGPEAISEVLSALERDEIVGVPTDTVYGLAARLSPAATERLFVTKGRPAELALPVLLGAGEQVDRVASTFPAGAALLARHFWPGPLTLVVRARRAVGPLLGGDGRTVGVRWPAHPLIEELCLAAGPLAVTSANRHGRPPATTAAELADSFDASEVAVVLDGGPSAGTPSSVVDCTRARPRLLREGAVPWPEVEAAWDG